ncbi:MAG TPA: HD domain-containing phosphohydrolase [Limnochordia bacterium]
MRKITIDMAKAGDRLARHVNGPDGRMLVAAQTELNDAMLGRLRELGVMSLYILDPRLADIPESRSISQATRAMGVSVLRDIEAALRANERAVSYEALHSVAEAIAADLASSNRQSVSLLDPQGPDEYRQIDALNVALVAMSAAQWLFPGQRLLDVGMAGLLHDIGMALLPPPVRDSRTRYTAEERSVMRRHPELGAAALKDAVDLSAYVKVAVLQHHERLDGSGYPRGSKGDDVHPFAQFIGLADLYVGAVSEKPWGERILPHDAIEMLMSLAGSEFDQDMIREFLRGVVPYPVGSTVRLNTGELGVIIDVPRHLPMRPTVRILETEAGEPLSEPVDVDLTRAEHQTKLVTEVLVV